jgi:hypothetical protein
MVFDYCSNDAGVRNKADVAACGNITGRCWNASEAKEPSGKQKGGLAHLHDELIKPFATAGLGISGIVWDQVRSCAFAAHGSSSSSCSCSTRLWQCSGPRVV